MSSRWCPHCETSWPTGDVRCMQCRNLTRLSHDKPIHTQEEGEAALARWQKRQVLAKSRDYFEKYYAKREEKRIAAGFLAPEGIGRREARQIIELEKGLAA